MAKSEKHIKDINELTEALGLDKMEGLDDMGNAELAEIAKGLRAQKKAADEADDKPSETPPSEEPKVEDTTPPTEDKPKKKKAKGPVVAEGKSILTRKGILTEGQTIGADMLSGGEESFKELKAKGYIEG